MHKSFWKKQHYWIPVLVGLVVGVLFCIFQPPSYNHADVQPTQPLFRGHVSCNSISGMAPQQMNLQGNLQVDHGQKYTTTFQYICNGASRSTDTIQISYTVNPDNSITFTWSSSEPVQWLSFIPILHGGENTGVILRPGQTRYTIRPKPGDNLMGATVDACAPHLPPGSIGVIPGTCQVSGGPPHPISHLWLFLLFHGITSPTVIPIGERSRLCPASCAVR